ncbi:MULTISPECIES: hypothetical protein [unclassified Streptomyces]|uniref:hypothetical protein n=1 Tax=unclassified Streptomyces TaxID=2593676 RepID=UPI000805CE20|nr:MULTISPECIES: hypothetical protein [unclassified Streptomyces]MYR75201.1 hypothetical protein [Streptomyces sp. SID4925]SBU98171.1 hypothetical protein YUMDRAFT_06080 [Streptomyces sp. OspMP-M45]
MTTLTALTATTDLDDTLDDLSGIHHGIDHIRHGLALLAASTHTADRLQTIIAALAGSDGADVLTAIAHTITHLTNPDTQPAVANLPAERRKACEHHGQLAAYNLQDPDLRTHTSNASAAISSY